MGPSLEMKRSYIFKAYWVYGHIFGNVSAYLPQCPCSRVCACASMWNAHGSYVNIPHVLSSLSWLCSLLFIDRRSEFISHCDSFLPGPGGKRIIVQIKSSDSAQAHNAHCVVSTGQTLSQVECCSGIFYTCVHEYVHKQWRIALPLLMDAQKSPGENIWKILGA